MKRRYTAKTTRNVRLLEQQRMNYAPAPIGMTSVPADQQGFTLTELALGLGVLSVIGAALFLAFGTTNVAAEVSQEQSHLRGLSQNVERAFGTLGSFEQVSVNRVTQDRLVPTGLLRPNETIWRSAWGGQVDIYPYQVNNPNDAFMVEYFDVPAEACNKLAVAVGPSVFDLRVGGGSVLDVDGVSPTTLSQRCAGGADMEFVYYSGLVAGSAVDADPLVLPPTVGSPGPVLPPQTNITITTPTTTNPVPPAGTLVLGPVSPGTPPPVVGVTPPPTPLPGGTLIGTPVTTPGPIGDPVGPPGCVAPPSFTEPNPGPPLCPAGQYGAITQSRTNTYTCPEAWESPVLNTGAWVVTSNTCTLCPAPSTENQSLACPVGQTGAITQERTVSYSCPAGTTVLPAPTYGAWTTVGNTCVPTASPCVAPPPSSTPTTRPAPIESQTLGCPAGQYGSITQERNRTENGVIDTTWTCPAPTGAATSSSTTTWLGTFNNGAWSTTSNTCLGCPAPSTQTDNPACPVGQTGSITRERSVSYSCPAGTTALPAPTFGAWVETINTCAPICPPPQTWQAQRKVACPFGESGEIIEEATVSATAICPTSPQEYNLSIGPWTEVSNSCTITCAGYSETEEQVVACPAPYTSGSITQRRVRNNTCATPVSPITPGTWTPWTPVSDTCTAAACGVGPKLVYEFPSSSTGWASGTAFVPAPSYQEEPGPSAAELNAMDDAALRHSITTGYVPADCSDFPTDFRSVNGSSLDMAWDGTCPAGNPYAYSEIRVTGDCGMSGDYVDLSYTVDSFRGVCRSGCDPVVTASVCQASAPEERTTACPVGQYGSIVERRTSSCPTSTGSAVWSGWTLVSNSCQAPDGNNGGGCFDNVNWGGPGVVDGVFNSQGGVCVKYTAGPTICYICP